MNNVKIEYGLLFDIKYLGFKIEVVLFLEYF